MILAGSHASAKDIARFRTEAEAVARLKHPHIVQIYEIGEHEGLPYLALELVDGPGLDAVVRQQMATGARGAKLVETLARAMHHVHGHGIVHRDLKPANVLLQMTECGPRNDNPRRRSATSVLESAIPKITDFGLAKLLDDEAANSPTRTLVGTPNYMAPEQAGGHGNTTGPLADVYSLGAILYELLTGRPPFQGKSVFAVLDQVRTHEVVPPGRVAMNVPRDLETICLKCLRKDPAERYANALDLAEDLRRWQANEPILARVARPWERAWKWTRRRPAVAGLVAVAVAATIVLTTLSLRHELDLQATHDQARTRERREQLDQLKQARLAFRTFAAQRDYALRHWTLATVLTSTDIASHLAATKEAGRLALAVVGLSDSSESAPRLNPYWSDREKSEITAGCYQLLLILADTTAQSTPRQGASNREQNLRQAITMLDRAANIFRPTQAYHLQRTRYLMQLGDEDGSRQEVMLGVSATPSGYNDYLLLGDERYQRGEFAAAAQNFKQALVLAPDDFWSQCFLAVCNLRLAALGGSRCRPVEVHRRQAGIHLGLCAARPGSRRAEECRGRGRRLSRGHATAARRRCAVCHLHFAGFAEFPAKRVGRSDCRTAKSHRAETRSNPRPCHAGQDIPGSWQPRQSIGAARSGSRPRAASCRGRGVPSRTEPRFLPRQAIPSSFGGGGDGRHLAAGQRTAHQQRGFVLVEIKRFKDAVASFDLCLAKGGKPGTDFYRAHGQAAMQLGAYLDASDDYSRAMDAGLDSELLTHRGWAFYFADAWQPANRDFDQALPRCGKRRRLCRPRAGASDVGEYPRSGCGCRRSVTPSTADAGNDA